MIPLQSFLQSQGKYLTAFERSQLMHSLQVELRPEYQIRIKTILLADEGYTQKQICTQLGCSQPTARYWMKMAQTGYALQWSEDHRGRPKSVNDTYRHRLQELVSQSPRSCGYPFQRWTARWLGKHLAKELGIKISDRHINRLLREMGLSTRARSSSQSLILDQPGAIEMEQDA